jgi:hypothetical protein
MAAQAPINVIIRRADEPTPGRWSAIAFAFVYGKHASLQDYEAYATGDTKAAAELAARQKAETGLRRQMSASR